jgi:hypothetical protein
VRRTLLAGGIVAVTVATKVAMMGIGVGREAEHLRDPCDDGGSWRAGVAGNRSR